jgi:hypothetical protein
MVVMVMMVLVMVRRFAHHPFAALDISFYVALDAFLDIVHKDLAADDGSRATKRTHEIFAQIVLFLRYLLVRISRGILWSLYCIW